MSNNQEQLFELLQAMQADNMKLQADNFKLGLMIGSMGGTGLKLPASLKDNIPILTNASAVAATTAVASQEPAGKHTAPAPAEEAEKPKRRKGAAKKQKAVIADITKMPSIEEEKLAELMPAIASMIPDGYRWPLSYKGLEKHNKTLDIKCEAMQLAYAILKKHRALLSPENTKRCSHDGPWFACCAMALIVAIERKRVWETVERDDSDFVITEADVPAGLAKADKKPEAEGEAKSRKVRFTKQTTFQLWQTLVGNDAKNKAILDYYPFPTGYQILCLKWGSDKNSTKKSASAFEKPEACQIVSKKTKQFLEELLPAEEWQREFEIFYVVLEMRDASAAPAAEASTAAEPKLYNAATEENASAAEAE
jgi:hypothetical protein